MNAKRLLALYETVAEAPNAIARMRRFVLDLAVRGKLVAQDPADEPASELLKRIAAERARLVEAGSLGRTKAAAPTAVDEDVELPSGWTAVYGFDLFPTRSGNSKLVKGQQHSEPADSLFPGFSAAGQDVWLDDWEHEGDAIILSAVGARCGKAFRATGKWSAIANTHVIWLLTSVTDPGFAMLHLNNEDFWLRSGGAQPFVKVKATLERPFLLPPLAEQRRIVVKVEELMALLDQLETARTTREATRDRLTAATLARLTAPDADPAEFPDNARFALATLAALTSRSDQIKPLRQVILNLAVRGKLVEQDPTDEPALDYLLRLEEVPAKTRKQLHPLDPAECGGDLPQSWVWLSLGAIIRGMDAGWSPQCENHARSSEDEWGVLKTTAVQALAFDSRQHKLLPAKLKPRPEYQAEVGDILVTRAGPKNRVGVSCVVDVPCPKLMISDKLIRFHAFGALSPRYIALTLNTGFTLEQIEAAKSGMAVMQMNISQAKLREIPLPLPPLAEQYRIVAKVEALMALCDRLEAALAAADSTRARLLEALLHEALVPADVVMAAAE